MLHHVSHDSILQFHESIAKEFKALKDRVRNLIGDAHWGEEGRYKEAVLRNVINRFLPRDISLGTGFILTKAEDGNRLIVSSQIDIIVYQNTIPVIFKEGEFIITTPDNVLGIIEVKTRIDMRNMKKTIDKFEENGKLIQRSRKLVKEDDTDTHDLFFGIFSYETSYSLGKDVSKGDISRLKRGMRNARYVNHISLGSSIFVKRWDLEDHSKNRSKDHQQHPPTSCRRDKNTGFYSIYYMKRLFNMHSSQGIQKEKEGLSFTYFISNLVYSVKRNNLRNREWYDFPISGGKEQNKKGEICIPKK